MGGAVRDKVVKKLAELAPNTRLSGRYDMPLAQRTRPGSMELREEIESLENMVERSARAPTKH